MDTGHKKWYDLIDTGLRQGKDFIFLLQVLKQMKEEGLEQQVACDILYTLHIDSRNNDKDPLNESQEDTLLEVMDIAFGFCSLHMRVWDGYIINPSVK